MQCTSFGLTQIQTQIQYIHHQNTNKQHFECNVLLQTFYETCHHNRAIKHKHYVGLTLVIFETSLLITKGKTGVALAT